MYERIYTVGCFDYFHDGHIKTLGRMREMGKTLIVGIHDDQSLEGLKNLKRDGHESIETRISKVKKYADHVYVIPSKDPTLYLRCMLNDKDDKKTACFVRGDDMPGFPGRDMIEKRISVEFLPYTIGISSTQIRNSLI